MLGLSYLRGVTLFKHILINARRLEGFYSAGEIFANQAVNRCHCCDDTFKFWISRLSSDQRDGLQVFMKSPTSQPMSFVFGVLGATNSDVVTHLVLRQKARVVCICASCVAAR